MNISPLESNIFIRKPEKGSQLFMVTKIEELITEVLKPDIKEKELKELSVELFHEMIATEPPLIYPLENTETINEQEVHKVYFDFYPTKGEVARKEKFTLFILNFLRKTENSHWQKFFPDKSLF